MSFNLFTDTRHCTVGCFCGESPLIMRYKHWISLTTVGGHSVTECHTRVILSPQGSESSLIIRYGLRQGL